MSAELSPLMASRVASLAEMRREFMMRSTFSTTTMASSTTMPMARMRPRRVSMLSEKPKMSMAPKVPMSEMGTAMTGMSVARQFWSERNTTRITSRRASKKVRYTWWIDSEIYVVMSKGMANDSPSGSVVSISASSFLTSLATSRALAPGSMDISMIAALPPLIPLSVE